MKAVYIGLRMASMACTNHPDVTVLSGKEVLDSKTRAEENTILLEGRFVKLEKIVRSMTPVYDFPK